MKRITIKAKAPEDFDAEEILRAFATAGVVATITECAVQPVSDGAQMAFTWESRPPVQEETSTHV